ncbi:MAG TPA: hypothetical protein PKK95_02850 [Vicinamibacterales bacterium]|nr:hypothetical protein [Acidobacteriota bacterium]HOC17175.1 hypothetical protein [Vicinamibacterales bacterium]
MKMSRCLAIILGLLLLAVAVPLADRGVQECTTAIFSASSTPDGRPILWKNRDTDTLSNKVVFVNDKPYSYLGVVNADDPDGRMVWGGLNSAGLAIANSVAYNLPQRGGEQADLEGIVMADVLRTCARVDDAERYFAANLGPDLGAQANFLVIDAKGGASIFEVHNHGFKRLDATSSPQGYMANTNFSRTGAQDQGAGYLRFDRETALLEAAPPRSFTPAFVLQTLARDLGHPLLANLAREEWKQFPADRPYWVHTNHTINRNSTASVLVVHGVKPGQDPRLATMWVILGEPVTGVAVPLWVAAGAPPAPLWEGKEAALTTEAFRLKDVLRPLKTRERREYADLARLDNASGTGWLPAVLEAERETLDQVSRLIAKNPSAAELAAFEKSAAEKALALLKGLGR